MPVTTGTPQADPVRAGKFRVNGSGKLGSNLCVCVSVYVGGRLRIKILLLEIRMSRLYT